MRTIAKKTVKVLINREYVEQTVELLQDENEIYFVNNEKFESYDVAIQRYFELNREAQKVNVLTAEDLRDLIENNKLKLTEAQKKVAEYLISDYKLARVNCHRASGGELMWKFKDSQNLNHAGSVYKAFNGLSYAIEKQLNIDINIWRNFSVRV